MMKLIAVVVRVINPDVNSISDGKEINLFLFTNLIHSSFIL
jgi:hypothetical protein